MKLRYECLVAHAPSVKISRTPVHDFELNHRGQLQLFNSKNKFITLQGPGIVYIDMQAGERFFKEVQLYLFLLLLYVALYLIMALILWFDKKDGKSRWGRGSNADSSAGNTDHQGAGDVTNTGYKSVIDAFFEALAGDQP